MSERSLDAMLVRERVANKPKHWVRAVTACNSKCLFCLDSDTPRNVYLSDEEVKGEIDRGRDELGAEKIIISGGEASLHPSFHEFVRHALSRGYDRVQTVTNGYRFAEKSFFDASIAAGLGEITFSLHGHTEELHDHLTQTPGAFRRIVKAIVRAVRSNKVIVNVDVVINKQNVGVLDKIVELCIALGVSEFDLLHVIPQAAAFDHRDELFYDVREHLPVLHKVFQLNRHPRFVVWTNRFPVSYLEGLEDLIQDPHKMLDEVNGRRFQLRRYIDNGDALDCRHPERCPHCFIEPFCTTADRVIADQNAARWEVWWQGDSGAAPETLPYGCTMLGLTAAPSATWLAEHTGDLYLDEADTLSLDALPTDRRVVLVARHAAQLDAWLREPLPERLALDVMLSRDTEPWLREHAARAAHPRVRVHQPAHEHMKEAAERDVRDPRALFAALAKAGVRLQVSGLPACLAPGMTLVEARRVLSRDLFDDESGRLDIRALARYHVAERYMAKSARCDDCRVTDRCDGAHINMVRDQGLRLLTPLVGAEADDASAQLEAMFPLPLTRLGGGRPPEPVAQSLPGRPPPAEAPRDPLALISKDRLLRRQRKPVEILHDN